MVDLRAADLSFTLPGSWWHIPLEDEQGIAGRVRAMMTGIIGRDDQQAQLRHELKAKVVSAATAAREADASDFYFAREIVPGVPIPVSLGVYAPDIPVGLSSEASAIAAAESLSMSMQRVDDDLHLVPAGGPDTAVLRGHKILRGGELAVAEQEEAGQLIVSYWLIQKGSGRVPLLSFATPLHAMADEMLELFDAIVSTVTTADVHSEHTPAR